MLLVLALVVCMGVLAACGGSSGPADRSKEIGAQIGGTCTQTSVDLLILSDVTSTPRLYNCTLPTGMLACYVERNGQAKDVTELAKSFLNLTNTPVEARPGCVRG